eukprot:4011828-Pyramimonas_sp.AAC.1
MRIKLHDRQRAPGPPGQHPGDQRQEALHIGSLLVQLPAPWIAMGGWNTTPERLRASGWPQATGANIATIPDGYT